VTPSSGGRPRENCRRLGCAGVARKLRETQDERDNLQWTLKTERENAFDNYSKGLFTAEQDAPAAAAQLELATVRNEKAQVDRNMTRYFKQARKLREERGELLTELAQAKGELSVALKTIAQTARREELQLRARGREIRQLEGAAASAQEQLEAVSASSAEEVAAAKNRADAAVATAAGAQDDAATAREEAAAEAVAAAEAKAQQDMAVYQNMLLQRQVDRAKNKSGALEKRMKELTPVGGSRSADDWAALKGGATRMAAQRARDSLRGFLKPHIWRTCSRSWAC
jgi:chromosome segregation ATPase